MSGVVGVDLQWSRTVLGLHGGAFDAPVHPVGDGRRRLIPNACRDGAWGSAAVDRPPSPEPAAGPAVNSAATPPPDGGATSMGAGPDLDPDRFVETWRVDPWDAAFLHGLADRLTGYLGRQAPVHRNGYHLVFCDADAGTGAALDPPSVRRRCAEAGLTDVSTVSPTDALLCRWLVDRGTGGLAALGHRERAFVGPVVCVASGQTWTAVARYELDTRDGREPVRRVGTQPRISSGTGELAGWLARSVLARCREGVAAGRLLPLLDATYEFGAQLSVVEAAEWSGALADNLFAPLRLTRRNLAEQEDVRRTTDAVRAAVGRVLEGAGRVLEGSGGVRVPVLVGGIGAVWPPIADAVARFGEVWRSPAPEEDLAAGACWWPRLRVLFADTSPRPPGPAGGPVPVTAHGDGAAAAPVEPLSPDVPNEPDDALPPWLRYS